MRNRLGLLALILLLGLSATGCGDDDSSGGFTEEEQAVIDAFVADLQVDDDPSSPFADEATARCSAEEFVKEIGAARLSELGITPDNVAGSDMAMALMTDEELQALADAMLGCVGRDFWVQMLVADGMPQDGAECFADGMLESDVLSRAMVLWTRDPTYDPADDPELVEIRNRLNEECLGS